MKKLLTIITLLTALSLNASEPVTANVLDKAALSISRDLDNNTFTTCLKLPDPVAYLHLILRAIPGIKNIPVIAGDE